MRERTDAPTYEPRRRTLAHRRLHVGGLLRASRIGASLLALMLTSGCIEESAQPHAEPGFGTQSTSDGAVSGGKPVTPLDASVALDAGRDARTVDGPLDAALPGECSEGSGFVFAPQERELYATLSPLPELPPDPTNAYADNAAAAALGQALFFETAYAGKLKQASDLGQVGESGKIACYSCHAGPYLDDQRSIPKNVSLGADFHTRNAPTTINSAFYRWTNWGGRFSAAWELPLPVAENPVIMNSSRLRIAHVIFDQYREQYNAVFEPDLEPAIGSDLTRFPAEGKPKPAASATVPMPPDGAWEAMAASDRALINGVFVNFGKALAAYMRLLVSRNAPFDRFVAGESLAIDCAAKRGLKLFVGKARCVHCHLGPHFSDDSFHNLGLPQSGPHVPESDDGRFKDIPPLLASPFSSATAASDDVNTGRLLGLTNPPAAETRGQFRTPDLRGVALTAPYMHAGQLASLEEVVDFYDRGGGTPASGSRDPLLVPLHLSSDERSDLRAFLGTLTGERIPDQLARGVAGVDPAPP
ncbi:MAG: uncharacterized protein JWN48_1830 [Myxococcaceae bacterium]|nr:uncharacterized protein [Myxococcaceae bacterium]